MTDQTDVPQGATESRDAAANDTASNRGRGRLWRRTAGTVAVVAVLIVGNAGSAQASTAQASTRPAGRTGSVTAAPSAGRDRTTSASALHGEFRVINRDGSAQLRLWQSGAVDAIDSLTVTVRSSDGFDSTYLIGPGVSVTGIGVGDEVTVVGAGPAVPV